MLLILVKGYLKRTSISQPRACKVHQADCGFNKDQDDGVSITTIQNTAHHCSFNSPPQNLRTVCSDVLNDSGVHGLLKAIVVVHIESVASVLL